MKQKFLYIIILLTTFLSASAEYTDHRNRKVDSLELILRKHPPTDKAELVRIYSDLAWGYLEINEKKSTHYCDLGIPLAKETQGWYKLGEFYRIKGMHHWANARYQQSDECLNQSMEAIEKMRESGKYDENAIDDQLSSVLGTQGNLYNSWGKGAKAVQCYLEALRIFQKHGWKESESVCYSVMAQLYYGMGNNKRAEEYLNKGVVVAKETGDSLMVCNNYRELAKIYMQRKEYAKAEGLMRYVHQYAFCHLDEEVSVAGDCMLIMADIAIAKGNLAKAEQIIQQHETLNYTRHFSDSQFDCQKAMLASLQGNWALTRQLAEKALEGSLDSQEIQIEASSLLAKAYAHLGEADKAVEMMNRVDSLKTKQANYAYQNSLSEQEARFGSEIKDMKIKELEYSRTNYLVLFLITLLLIVALSIVTFYRRRAIKRQKELLTAQVTMETEVKERQMLAKDLHDGLGGTLSLLKLKIREQVTGESLQILDKSIADLRRISHHIMPEELITHGLEVSLRDFAASVPGAQFHFFGERNPLSQDIELVLYRCAYELVNNAMKHAEASRIDIQLVQASDSITLTVGDDGKGFDTTPETKGMGLQNIRNRIASYHGNMEIISQPGNGTEINVTILLCNTK